MRGELHHRPGPPGSPFRSIVRDDKAQHDCALLFVKQIRLEKDFLRDKIFPDVMHVGAELDLIKCRLLRYLSAGDSKASCHAGCGMTMRMNVRIPFGLYRSV